MAESPKDGQVLPGWGQVLDLPMAHLVLKVVDHGGLVGGRMQQDDAQTSAKVRPLKLSGPAAGKKGHPTWQCASWQTWP